MIIIIEKIKLSDITRKRILAKNLIKNIYLL
mgnify:CR=1 FL=1